MMEAILPPKHWFLQEPHGVTSQNTEFFIVTTMKISDLTQCEKCLVNNNNKKVMLSLISRTDAAICTAI
jgi:hypothetical protein